jgi:kynureninase
MSRADCLARDVTDPLAHARDRFSLPNNTIYLDGNSLGAMPKAAPAVLQAVAAQQWGNDLIRSWNTHNWVSMPQRIGGKIAALLGAQSNEIVATDSTSVNLFKLLAGWLQNVQMSDDPARCFILCERGNFPTDVYIADGITKLFTDRFEIKFVDSAAQLDAQIDATTAIVMLTQVDYRSGQLHNMAALNAKAQAAGTVILWDLAHSAGAVPIHLNADGAKLAVGCGYKYLNGGPGAPAFAYLAQELHGQFPSAIQGWFAHAKPFAFHGQFNPASDAARLLCGTPPVLSMAALECGVDTFAGIDMQQVREKSSALSALFLQYMEPLCAQYQFSLFSPHASELRGSHLSYAHVHGYAIMQALIAQGVIGDFREPNLLRFGFTPLYTRFADVWDAVAILKEIMASRAYEASEFNQRAVVP